MNIIYKITQPAWWLFKSVSRLLGYSNPMKSKLWAWLIIAVAWLLAGHGLLLLFGWDVYDYDNDAVQLKLTLFALAWYVFGVYLALGIYINKLNLYEKTINYINHGK